jgi:N-acetylglucosamine transport system substrate-binding protein
MAATLLVAACGSSASPTAPATNPPAESAAPTESAPAPLFGYEFAKNQEQWARLPGDHVPGTMVTQDEWYKILGEPPAEPIELALFKGGFGEEWGQVLVDLMEKEHPGVKLNLNFDPEIWTKIQPNLVAGEVPDFLFYAYGPWGGDWKTGVEEKQIMPADFLLDVEAYGDYGSKRLGDQFFPGSLESAAKGLTDHQWTFPQTQFTYGIFYNGKLFDENGWPDPSTLTWEEFMDLQAEIAKVMPVWAYAGANAPGYFGWLTTPLMYKTVGADAWCKMANLEPGAFENPGLAWAAEQHQQIIKNGWLLPGTEALDHTQSQQAFVEGKVAMVPNGSWLENEQRATTPAGFEMRYASIPAPANALGFPAAVEGLLGDSDMEIGNGKNPLWAMEVMRLFYSPEMAEFWGTKIGSPLPLIGAATGPVSGYTKSIASALAAADGHLIKAYHNDYPAIGKVSGDNYQDLIHGKISAADYFALLERAAEETRNDASITKTPYTCN